MEIFTKQYKRKLDKLITAEIISLETARKAYLRSHEGGAVTSYLEGQIRGLEFIKDKLH